MPPPAVCLHWSRPLAQANCCQRTNSMNRRAWQQPRHMLSSQCAHLSFPQSNHLRRLKRMLQALLVLELMRRLRRNTRGCSLAPTHRFLWSSPQVNPAPTLRGSGIFMPLFPSCIRSMWSTSPKLTSLSHRRWLKYGRRDSAKRHRSVSSGTSSVTLPPGEACWRNGLSVQPSSTRICIVATTCFLCWILLVPAQCLSRSKRLCRSSPSRRRSSNTGRSK
mmetsp:Transcript_23494/g.60270  ORF Transcript_23494/g.60270 Transcript_23494/m.60270 type:complete len:220 (-) Transcript_23494:288-947(-)